jgi:deoxyribose-phosphate aldolase
VSEGANMVDLARFIDHTLLKAEATEGEIRRVVEEAIKYRFAGVCVNGRWVRLVAELLRAAGADRGERAVATAAVVGFPLGAGKSSVKAMEAVAAVKDGAGEIDMVVALDMVLGGDLEEARGDVFEVVRGARAVRKETVVKVILETAVLKEEQVALGCRAAREGGADYVKTSTGFHPKGGATEEAVRWLLKYGEGMKVKASGGIRDRVTAEKYIGMGVARIGTSSGVKMMG